MNAVATAVTTNRIIMMRIVGRNVLGDMIRGLTVKFVVGQL